MNYIAAKPIIFIGILTFSLSCFGQNNDSLIKTKTVRPVSQTKKAPNTKEKHVYKSNKTQTVSNGQRRLVLSNQEKIQAIKSHIEAIDKKVDYVNSDDDLKSKAIQNNWFNEMQAIREELVAELNELKND